MKVLRHTCTGLLLATALLAATGCCCWRPFAHRRACLSEPCCGPCEPCAPCCAPCGPACCSACGASPVAAMPPAEALVPVPIPAPRPVTNER